MQKRFSGASVLFSIYDRHAKPTKPRCRCSLRSASIRAQPQRQPRTTGHGDPGTERPFRVGSAKAGVVGAVLKGGTHNNKSSLAPQLFSTGLLSCPCGSPNTLS